MGSDYYPPPGLQRVATTGMAGFPLQNGTPTILSWTAPNDGQLHVIIAAVLLVVTAAESGGQINWKFGAVSNIIISGSLGVGEYLAGYGQTPIFQSGGVLRPGDTFAFTQGSALTSGAATAYAEIWSS